jgi:hypothetical protein
LAILGRHSDRPETIRRILQRIGKMKVEHRGKHTWSGESRKHGQFGNRASGQALVHEESSGGIAGQR